MLKVSTFSTTSASAVAYKGAWNADTNTPPLASGMGASGAYYVVSVPGTTELDDQSALPSLTVISGGTYS